MEIFFKTQQIKTFIDLEKISGRRSSNTAVKKLISDRGLTLINPGLANQLLNNRLLIYTATIDGPMRKK